jgi:NAD(P)-dependent dehydrogenase (short-subunit alcohol dehydrogenase family)
VSTPKVVLVTGGTRGIGLASALAYARTGAHAVITHAWGSADEDELRARFRDAGGPAPLIVEADVGRESDADALFDEIAAHHDRVDVFVSNAAAALKIGTLDDYDRRGLLRSVECSAWPLWGYTRRIRERFGRYPRSVIGLSSDGPDGWFDAYDFVAASKAVLETLCKYMNARLYTEGVRVNVVRSRMVQTDALTAAFGEEFPRFIRRLGFADCFVTPEEVADVVCALGSGQLDAIGGQVIMADRGFSFFDNAMGIYSRLEERGVTLQTMEKAHDEAVRGAGDLRHRGEAPDGDGG